LSVEYTTQFSNPQDINVFFVSKDT